MSMIEIKNVSFSYPGSAHAVFENVNLQIDSNWKLGLSGRNGRGKTTLLHILEGSLEYVGQIDSNLKFTYFPFCVKEPQRNTLSILKETIAPFGEMEEEMEKLLQHTDGASLEKYGEIEQEYARLDGYQIEDLIEKEISKLGVNTEILRRPYSTLSGGEQTKSLLACLFLKKNHFLLIDEPTNHLDLEAREVVSSYLKSKSSYILVSHDRHFLDGCIDHVLSINRSNITVEKGSFSGWLRNKERLEQFELAQNEKLKKDITRLQKSAMRTAGWSEDVEKTKNGKRIAGLRPDRGYLGHMAAKMMKRSKTIEARREKAIEEKQALFKNQELLGEVKAHPLVHGKKQLLFGENLSVSYKNKKVFSNLNFSLSQGQRMCLKGPNGSGKTTLVKLILGEAISYTGTFQIASGLTISYVSQDTSALRGTLQEYAEKHQLDLTLFLTVLRKLGFSRETFQYPIDTYSGGQKKKVLLAGSIATSAHLYLWDEPLNFIDLDARIQIEEMLLNNNMTMLFVEHDKAFQEKVATEFITLF